MSEVLHCDVGCKYDSGDLVISEDLMLHKQLADLQLDHERLLETSAKLRSQLATTKKLQQGAHAKLRILRKQRGINQVSTKASVNAEVRSSSSGTKTEHLEMRHQLGLLRNGYYALAASHQTSALLLSELQGSQTALAEGLRNTARTLEAFVTRPGSEHVLGPDN